jgi:uncharacterized protein (TIGR00288 family)
MNNISDRNKVAFFMDFENIKRAVDEFFDADDKKKAERVNIKQILAEVMDITQGRIVLKKAYADWGNFRDYRSDLLDNAMEPIQAFALAYSGKNGADIKITIEVMEFALRQPDIQYIVLVSGDSDFTPLVMKLREFGREVIGVGVRSNTSANLAKACDHFLYYDDFCGLLPATAKTQEPMDAGRLVALALAKLGNQQVGGSALKQQMRKLDPLFDETRGGHGSFFEFLKAQGELVDVHKPAIGDLVVAPKGMLGMTTTTREAAYLPHPAPIAPIAVAAVTSPAVQKPGYKPYVPSDGIPYQAPPPRVVVPEPEDTLAEEYKFYLRDNNFRYVPTKERQEIIQAFFTIFQDMKVKGSHVTLKESKDRLHEWFETNRPAVPWDSINTTVYHLFYTWCFDFDKTDEAEGKQLWDRRTRLHASLMDAIDLQRRCDMGIVRIIWEWERDETDAEALGVWLYDGDDTKYPYLEELIATAPTYVANR